MVLWVTLVFDPHWWLAAHGPAIILKLPVLLLVGLLVVLMFGVPNNPVWKKQWQWYAPFLMYILAGAITLPVVINAGYAREALQGQLLWWAFIVGTVALVDTVKRAETLLVLYAFQFLWWGAWGGKMGLVQWHTVLSNYDAFGAINVGGLAICYFLALASPIGRFRLLMYVATGLCTLGIVASFARGAVLATAAVYAIIWIRSPNKVRTLFAGIGVGIIVAVASTLLFDEGFFVAEIMSTFEEGTSEGTGEERWILWGAAWRVFQEHPLFGAGPRNWGVFGSTFFDVGELGRQYANPGALYNMSLHSLYMTTLSELGLFGSFALLWIIVDYFRRNAALRTEAAQQRWQMLGGRFNLKHISLGLESAMVAFMVNAAFYSMLVIHWFFTMLALNLVLHSIAVRGASSSERAAPARPMRQPPRAIATPPPRPQPVQTT
jgi:O-antigen ligase